MKTQATILAASLLLMACASDPDNLRTTNEMRAASVAKTAALTAASIATGGIVGAAWFAYEIATMEPEKAGPCGYPPIKPVKKPMPAVLADLGSDTP